MIIKLIQKLRNSAPLRSLLQGHFFTSITLLYRIEHFYSPIVHPEDARSRAAQLWKNHDEMAGVDLRAPAQLELLKQLAAHTASIDYPKTWLIEQGRNWTEQYLLRAFLQYNADWEVVWAAHFMGTRHTKEVQEAFPRNPEVGGGGRFWIQRR